MHPVRFTRTVATLLLLVLVATRALAGASPEETVSGYFAALRTAGPVALADYSHAEDLVRFKTEIQKIFGEAETNPALAAVIPQGLSLAEIQEALKSMEPAEFFREYLRPSTQTFQTLGIQFGAVEVLGSVPEGKQVHVLVRSTATRGAKGLTELQVITVKSDGGRWRLTGGEPLRSFARIARELGKSQ